MNKTESKVFYEARRKGLTLIVDGTNDYGNKALKYVLRTGYGDDVLETDSLEDVQKLLADRKEQKPFKCPNSEAARKASRKEHELMQNVARALR